MRVACLSLILSLWPIAGAADEPVSYGRVIRPILAENCFYCHGQDPNHRKADVRLDTSAGQRSGGIITPGDPAASEVIRRILADDPAEQMPPPDSNRRLTPSQKDLVRRWVAEGASFEGHWAYQAPVRSPLPADPVGPNPIDAFILAQLRAAGLAPAAEAGRRTLLRRVTLDLTGLPPTLAELDSFLADDRPDAYGRLVDRLLASPHYGERMALPWLEAARYADSNGFQQDGDTFQWIWRDWVVAALNRNMPFDQFTVEQIAGDLLPDATAEQRVATAFNRNHLLNGEGGAIPEEQRFNILFDRVDVTATNWLGLTVACAQCHDHKYDPITQRDYYRLLAAFNNVGESGVVPGGPTRVRVAPPILDVATAAQKAQLATLDMIAADLRSALSGKQGLWEAQVRTIPDHPDRTIRSLLDDIDPTGKETRVKEVAEYFKARVEPTLAGLIARAEQQARACKDDYPRVMVMADDRPRPTHVLDRGEYLKPREAVECGPPAFLPPLAADAPRDRLGLARWLVAPANPLTARVAVNRAWQTFFGVGLVPTSEDFGVQGDVPAHPELLDWLAVEFRESGWDVKRLHRLIVTSATYKQSARVAPEGPAHDPANRLLARFPRTRLPAMLLRDLALAASGLLDPQVGGKPVYPYQPTDVWAPLAITKERDFTYPTSLGTDLHRRSLYTFWRRTIGPANMFDAAPRQACKVRPSLTNTPLHALTTLNDPTWTEAARVLAERAIHAGAEPEGRFAVIFRRILTREPSAAEQAVLRRMLAEQAAAYRADPTAARDLLAVGIAPRDPTIDPAEHAAWTNLCLAVFNLDEALTRE